MKKQTTRPQSKVTTNAHISKTVKHLSTVNEQIKELQARRDAAQDIIREFVGHEPGKICDILIVTKKGIEICVVQTCETERFDSVRFSDLHPALAEQFIVKGTRTNVKIK